MPDETKKVAIPNMTHMKGPLVALKIDNISLSIYTMNLFKMFCYFARNKMKNRNRTFPCFQHYLFIQVQIKYVFEIVKHCIYHVTPNPANWLQTWQQNFVLQTSNYKRCQDFNTHFLSGNSWRSLNQKQPGLHFSLSE